MRVLVIGRDGQVARTLVEQAPAHDATVTLMARPELDLAVPASIAPALRRAGGDIIVNAAAYTAVDRAEAEPELALAINGVGAGAVAAAAAAMDVPVVQISTDYVFDGTQPRPYRESDPVAPLGAYGRSKLLGEHAVAEATANHVILRTAWVYAPFGNNFVRTMLRLAAEREEVGVVADQHGNPTSAHDIADGILAVCRNLLTRPEDEALRGVFHMTAAGEASWADLAETVFSASARHGGPQARVRRIETADYPTPARRPANSRLDCSKLSRLHGIALPGWEASVATRVARLLAAAPADPIRIA
jgi:dTDP-4-dehydrorhamnose reductase